MGGFARGLVDAAQKAAGKAHRIVLADPEGSGIYGWIKRDDLSIQGSAITEGIGQSRVTANLDGAPIDDAERIADPEALEIIYSLLIDEGLSVGGSSGINVASAIRTARKLGPGHRIVTILCDGGARYQSKLFNPEFLRSKNLPVAPWLDK